MDRTLFIKSVGFYKKGATHRCAARGMEVCPSDTARTRKNRKRFFI